MSCKFHQAVLHFSVEEEETISKMRFMTFNAFDTCFVFNYSLFIIQIIFLAESRKSVLEFSSPSIQNKRKEQKDSASINFHTNILGAWLLCLLL